MHIGSAADRGVTIGQFLQHSTSRSAQPPGGTEPLPCFFFFEEHGHDHSSLTQRPVDPSTHPSVGHCVILHHLSSARLGRRGEHGAASSEDCTTGEIGVYIRKGRQEGLAGWLPAALGTCVCVRASHMRYRRSSLVHRRWRSVCPICFCLGMQADDGASGYQSCKR